MKGKIGVTFSNGSPPIELNHCSTNAEGLTYVIRVDNKYNHTTLIPWWRIEKVEWDEK